jgi:hypothetical protein
MILREKFVCNMEINNNELIVGIRIATSTDSVQNLQDSPLKN